MYLDGLKHKMEVCNNHLFGLSMIVAIIIIGLISALIDEERDI